MIRTRALMIAAVAVAIAIAAPTAQASRDVSYVVTFPAPEHHWMQVDATFPALEPGPFSVRMSRSSPGRYAVHEFAKNVFAIDAVDGSGAKLPIARSGVDEWTVARHDGTVRVTYRIFGDQVDGTYLAIDSSHAHVNMPAAFLWASGLEGRAVRVRFVVPSGSSWRVGTQLFSTGDAWSFTAPNLQYFMDSPTELSNFVTSTFTARGVGGPEARIRLVVHALSDQSAADQLARLVERLVQEEIAVYGELPAFEGGQYTFLLDYVPWADGDGMEHRNSTIITSGGVTLTTPEGRQRALDTIAHEFFHAWNVERIRPAGIEPFDFTRQNVTCCLWLAEGFTEYYGRLLLRRAGLSPQVPTTNVALLVNAPGRAVRSAVEMSEHAPFADAGVANDVDDRSRTFLSYYTHGAALALALDLSLRDRSAGRVSLDDFMRRLWDEFGKPADARVGYVARPYTLADLRRVLGQVGGDPGFANEFFDRYVEGREVPDFERLLSLAGYSLRPVAPGRASLGTVPMREDAGGLLVGGGGFADRPVPVPFGSPLHDAGIDSGDVITSIDGRPATMAAWLALGDRKPGDRVSLIARRRDGRPHQATATLQADPTMRVIPVESTGAALSAGQTAFRGAWLGSKVAR